tara:strand:+ start:1165 stop:1464 length:300 start_codon:yes stop_codon:yes gene_type:complete
MEQRDLEMIEWSVRRCLNELFEYLNKCSSSVLRLSKIDEDLEGLDPEHISEFYFLAERLVDTWVNHSQGRELRGELTANTFKDVLDRNVLLSETANNKE